LGTSFLSQFRIGSSLTVRRPAVLGQAKARKLPSLLTETEHLCV
jgi:hypothetical protein